MGKGMERKGNGRHQDWQRCMGVEPTLGRANGRADGFEDRQAPFATVQLCPEMAVAPAHSIASIRRRPVVSAVDDVRMLYVSTRA